MLGSDSFTGNTESPLTTNWSNGTVTGVGDGMKGISNAAGARTSSAQNVSFWDAATFEANQYSQVKILDNTLYPGVMVRHDTTNDDCYFLWVRDVNRIRFQNIGGDILLQTWTNAGRYVNNGTLKESVSGNIITVWWDGVSQGTYTDTSNHATTGPAGIYSYGISTAVPTLDDWEGGNLSDAAPPAGGSVVALPVMAFSKFWSPI
jgi:hypothetical protein